MMVTFVSQCEKNALKKTRRVLDAFADRIGSNTWQTVITQDGLEAVKKLLRKTASKNTAVSCHWIRSRSRFELVWVVGNRHKFNQQGTVPVNSTRRVLTGSEWETGWTMATSIQLLSTLAALLHDLGKSTLGFQKKLISKGPPQADPYRHEWLSLRIFEAMIQGCSTDREWLERFQNFSGFIQKKPDWMCALHNDSKETRKGFDHFPPLAKLIAWLIVTHHRLPLNNDDHNFSEREQLCRQSKFLKTDMARFYQRLAPYNGWVRSETACKERSDNQDFWSFAALATESQQWQKKLQRWSARVLNHPPLLQLPELNNPLLLHLSRLCLMVGDHNYSSLDINDKRRVKGDPELEKQLTANTCRKTGEPRQALDEHLLGVASFTAQFSRLLPRFFNELPRLESLSAFAKRTPIPRFQWQNRAWNLVKKHHKEARKQGFFGVSLASTGCGKTLGNARIMAGLADPETGPRFSIALGLRVLTLQTGQALRDRLKLDDSELAILVGGSAHRTLFELQQKENSAEADYGSESAGPLITDSVDYHQCALDTETLGTIIQDPKAQDLLYAPVVSCTIDHIISATETTRGGRHIVPMLRLLTSDLILDEPDDFDPSDLPALTRLVHMAGMLGSNVLLSSATLTPDLIEGLFIAYQTGRAHWQINLGETGTGIYCAWFDEFGEHLQPCTNEHSFAEQHQKFIAKRVKALQAMPPKHVANILPTELPKAPENEKINNSALAQTIISASKQLHLQHHETCPNTGKTASVGLVRLANINPMFALARALYQLPIQDDVHIHLCCYHARQLLLLRNQLEQKLDRILNRNNGNNLLDHPEIAETLRTSDKPHHIFIVLATAVAEVGRDHDYDWAIIEPSSMRSIIQLVGRVWRHRPDKIAGSPNVLILDNNIKALQAGSSPGIGDPVFNQPGFESKTHRLQTHACSQLITEAQLANINSIPRIARPANPQPGHQLADLEHVVMADLLNARGINVVNAFWQPNTAMQANIHLQRATPFRDSTIRELEYVAMPDADHPASIRFRELENAWKDLSGQESVNSKLRYTEFVPIPNANMSPWLANDFPEALETLCEKLDESDEKVVARRFATVSLAEEQNWCFHPWFGFWPA